MRVVGSECNPSNKFSIKVGFDYRETVRLSRRIGIGSVSAKRVRDCETVKEIKVNAHSLGMHRRHRSSGSYALQHRLNCN